MNNSEIDRLAKIVWDYHHLNQKVEKADCIFVLGSHDTRVAEYAAELFLKGFAPLLIFSGGVGDRVSTRAFNKSEAEVFAEIAVAKGVPKEKIIIETKAKNTGDNIIQTRKLLQEKGIDCQKFILVQKPYMERRTFATFKKVWPEKDCIVTSPPISWENYPNEKYPKNNVIGIMLGDLQRIKIYPSLGFQIPQEIPPEVWGAYEKLVAAGFGRDLVK